MSSNEVDAQEKPKEEGELLAAARPLTDIHAGGQPTSKKVVVVWRCQECRKNCVNVRDEARCLCGHRLKDHAKANSLQAAMACSAARCACPSFFYIVAQGAWILRCRCKHKHTEHDPGSHGCARPTCACSKFDSPWVCNCDHPWASHTQLLQESDARSLQELVLEGEQVSEADALDLIKRGSIDTPGTS